LVQTVIGLYLLLADFTLVANLVGRRSPRGKLGKL
jgi:hypothetical protein